MCECGFALEYVDTVIFDDIEGRDGQIGEEIYECPVCGEQTRSPLYFEDDEEL